jgi:heme/copper-type cytochrome/quinol oxidase subunit 1
MNNIYRITNNKRLGIYYIICSIIYGICGTLISIIIRIELYSSGNRIISIENIHQLKSSQTKAAINNLRKHQ